MRITIVNGWHDDNKGDSAIVEATLAAIRAARPDAQLGLVSELHAGDAALKDAHRFLLARFPDLEIAPAVAPVFVPGRKGMLGRARAAASWGLRFARSALPTDGDSPGERMIRGSDLVVSKGGHFIHARRRRLFDWTALYQTLHPLRLARRSGVPYVVLGQSIGPFVGAASRRMTRDVLAGAAAIVLREGISMEVARGLGLPERLLSVHPDLAFAVRPDATPRVKAILQATGLEDGNFWAVTVRQRVTLGYEDSRKGESRFLGEMESFLARALERDPHLRLALVVHSRGPTAREDDRPPTYDLERRLARFAHRITLVDEDLRPAEMAALYGSARLVVGTRFHSVILAFAGGAPALAISYFGPKAEGIMAMMGRADLCLGYDEFTASEALGRIERLDLDAERRDVAKRTEALRSEVQTVVEECLALAKAPAR